MNEFRKYDSVERYGKEEVEDILKGTCYIFEKLDGCNISVFFNAEQGLVITSRNRILYSTKDGLIDNMRGVVDYIKERPNIAEMCRNNYECIFYAEYLTKHTVKYPIEHTNHLFFFDVFDTKVNKYVTYEILESISNMYEVNYIPVLAILDNPTIEQCKEYLNINNFKGDPQQEGIVIKNYSYYNKFGRPTYAKIVNEQFKEVKHCGDKWVSECCKASTYEQDGKVLCGKCNLETKVFKGRLLDSLEEKISGKYITEARIEKIINKIIDSHAYKNADETIYKNDLTFKISEKIIPELLGITYNDIITEEMWSILKEFKNPIIDFKKLKKEVDNVTKIYFFKYLENERKL
jgi:hypothetical protein